jgi:predicted RNA-binding protein associated with RNAse of E/G family
MNKPTLFRRRFIPEELVHLKDDIILVMEQDLIITKWNTLRPRKDIARGISAYYLDKGFKISKIFDSQNRLVYWYCDIIQAKKDDQKNTVIIEDLLVDLILYDDGSMRILDLDELADAVEQKLITQAEANFALRRLHALLQILYSGQFFTLQEPVNKAEAL